MDQQAFDRLTKLLDGGQTRRAGIRALIVGLATGFGMRSSTLANPGRRHEKLACRNANSECTSDDQCCSGSCVPKPEGGTGFRCAKRHKKTKNKKDKDTGPAGPFVPVGEPCVLGGIPCERGSCQQYAENPWADDTVNYYCLLNIGDGCNAADSLPNATCVSHYCSSPNGNSAGECGPVDVVNSCLDKNMCDSDVLYVDVADQWFYCIESDGGSASMYLAGGYGSCSTSADCAWDQVCFTQAAGTDNYCSFPLYSMVGQCVTGFMTCDPKGSWQTQCPMRGSTAATACSQYQGLSVCNYGWGG